jgi:hypothetical protein
VFSLSEDASAARLVVSGEAGRLYVATITGESALELLALERPLGALVRLLQGPAGSFEVSVIETQSPDDGSQGPDATVAPGRPDRPAGDAPALVSIGGVVVDGGDGVLTVRTRRGLVTVETSQATRVASGRTGLSDDQVLDGEGAAGYLVVVRGGLDAETHNVLADVILVRRAAR